MKQLEQHYIQTQKEKRMGFSEKILLALSHESKNVKEGLAQETWTIENSLGELKQAFPGFVQKIAGKKILDYGCGFGFQSIALALRGAQFVCGVDLNEKHLMEAREMADKEGVAHCVSFKEKISPQDIGTFDIVISQNSMEHFPEPEINLGEMKNALKKNGEIFLTFGPPWFAPYGSHMRFFTKVPWVNILFSEKTVMNVRKRFRQDGAERYQDIESGLNKMSLAKFEKIVAESGLKILSKEYLCIKKIKPLGRIPILRELFVNQINCVLTKN